MIHADECKCVNCEAKGSPFREIFLREVTDELLTKIEIFDWLEGIGQIFSLSQRNFIRKYGFLLVKQTNKVAELKQHIEALEAVCEKYISADKLDEANDEVIHLCKGDKEEIGRKLLAKKPIKKYISRQGIKSSEDK